VEEVEHRADALLADYAGGMPSDAQQLALTARADIALVRTSIAIETNEPELALEYALQTRQRALDAVHALAYIGATNAIAVLENARGDRYEAYRALATGWATLEDLLGAEIAREAFQLKLNDLRAQWGEAAFEAVRAAYENDRRTARPSD
jgi:hypothetical protein